MTTHTYALLEVSDQTFEEIKDKLKRAGYQDQFHDDDGRLIIDLHGLALVKEIDDGGD